MIISDEDRERITRLEELHVLGILPADLYLKSREAIERGENFEALGLPDFSKVDVRRDTLAFTVPAEVRALTTASLVDPTMSSERALTVLEQEESSSRISPRKAYFLSSVVSTFQSRGTGNFLKYGVIFFVLLLALFAGYTGVK